MLPPFRYNGSHTTRKTAHSSFRAGHTTKRRSTIGPRIPWWTSKTWLVTTNGKCLDSNSRGLKWESHNLSEWFSHLTMNFQQHFKCCPNPWVLLYAHLVIRRKPLYYVINLVSCFDIFALELLSRLFTQVIPTSIITIVAITGFFTPTSTSSERDEKLWVFQLRIRFFLLVSRTGFASMLYLPFVTFICYYLRYLGINTLLTMSIMMLMVCNQMPSTSTYVPLMSEWRIQSLIQANDVNIVLPSYSTWSIAPCFATAQETSMLIHVHYRWPV